MILAVFSDVHSNHTALRACFAEAERRGADKWIFLGDYVSDCACPHQTMQLLYEAQKAHECFFIKGNREEYILSHHKNGSDWKYGTTTGSLLYTYENMTARDLEFIDALPYTQEINPNGKCPILLCHGSPAKTREALYPHSYSTERWLLKVKQPLFLGGHSHRPNIARGYGHMYMNPGAVGIPVTGVPQSEMGFLVSDGAAWQPELVRVPYDVEKTMQEIIEAGLPEKAFVWSRAMLKQLREGKNYSLFVVERAAELAAGGAVEERHWMQAAEDLGLLPKKEKV